ncbi:YlmH/Sll1252 family protein [Lachnospiraceae bacterium 46-61]
MQKQLQQQQKFLFAKVLDAAQSSILHHKKTTTDFMDRHKSEIFFENVKSIQNVKAMVFGGYEQSERRMIAFAPDYMELTEQDFPIQALHITKNKKFGQADLNHRDYLGSILALGIDRAKLGDIIVLEQQTICYVHKDLAEYIKNTLEYVSHTKVDVSINDISAVTLPEKEWKYQTITVASLRLDAVAGGAFHMARGKVQQYIKKELVQLNWNTTTNTSCLLKQGDMISIRGFGRIKIFEIGNITKKDRICVTIGRE